MAKEPKPSHVHLLVPFGTHFNTVHERVGGELRKRKEERKGESEIRVIGRIVRSFEIRTKLSTHSNDQFGISLSLIFSIRNPKFRFDSCFFRLKF